jgi:hypothetical protein
MLKWYKNINFLKNIFLKYKNKYAWYSFLYEIYQLNMGENEKSSPISKSNPVNTHVPSAFTFTFFQQI